MLNSFSCVHGPQVPPFLVCSFDHTSWSGTSAEAIQLFRFLAPVTCWSFLSWTTHDVVYICGLHRLEVPPIGAPTLMLSTSIPIWIGSEWTCHTPLFVDQGQSISNLPQGDLMFTGRLHVRYPNLRFLPTDLVALALSHNWIPTSNDSDNTVPELLGWLGWLASKMAIILLAEALLCLQVPFFCRWLVYFKVVLAAYRRSASRSER